MLIFTVRHMDALHGANPRVPTVNQLALTATLHCCDYPILHIGREDLWCSVFIFFIALTSQRLKQPRDRPEEKRSNRSVTPLRASQLTERNRFSWARY